MSAAEPRQRAAGVNGADAADAIARLRLIRTRSVGPVSYAQLLGRFGSAAAALAALPDLARRGGGKPPAIPSVAAIEAERSRVAEIGGRYLFADEAAYPRLLREVESAPPVLIVAGDGALLERPIVAVIGARNASAAAIRFARALAHDLADLGYVVASGLARGIDTAAHAGALDGGTIGVIAGGLDVVYPPENAELQQTIAARGLVVAEMPPGTEPRARHFPYRNRIIAGIAQGTIVVEAAPRSGSLITARLAAEMGREVMAVPGSPLDPRAQGCNQLIRDGATLIQSAEDVRGSLAPFGRSYVSAPAEPYQAAPATAGELAEDDRRTIIALLGPTAVPVDEVIRLSGQSTASVQLVLLELELAGRLQRHAGGRVSLEA